MAHFAKVYNGVVRNVIVADQDFIDSYNDGEAGKWIQTSYNTRGGVHYDPSTGKPSNDQSKALRKNFASKGSTYDKAKDAFIPKSPYPSWLLNEDTCLWEPPVAMPKDNKRYTWNESIKKWEVNNG